MSHHFSDGTLNIDIAQDVVEIVALSGIYKISQNAGRSTIKIGSCRVAMNLTGGVSAIEAEQGITMINATGGSVIINTGCGYTAINSGSGICEISTPSGDIGTTKITLGSGITVVNGSTYCGWLRSLSTVNQAGGCFPHGCTFTIGSGDYDQYETQVDVRKNRCIINGKIFENGVEVSGRSSRSFGTNKQSRSSTEVPSLETSSQVSSIEAASNETDGSSATNQNIPEETEIIPQSTEQH